MSSFPFYPPTATSTPLYGGALFPPPPPTPSHIEQSHLGLRYVTAISIGFLLLLAVVLFSYICFRFYRRGRLHQNPNPNPNSNAAVSDNGIMLPRVIFVAEDDDGDTENAVVGLDQAVINSYPKFPFVRGGGNETVCAICLCEYKEAEMLRMLPDCRHYFHLTCVDEWLKLNASCPVCRNSPLPTPLSTPLAEVVPLSLYTDGRNRRR